MEKKEITDFPDKGDDKEISIRNSKYKQFDYEYASSLKENYKQLWNRYATGGSGEDRTSFTGNDAFNAWTRYREGSRTKATLDWVKRRENYFDRFSGAKNSLANSVGHIKWGGYTSNLTESEIKKIVNEEKKRLDDSKTFLCELEKEDAYIKAETWEEAEEIAKELYGDKAKIYGELIQTINLEKGKKMENNYLNTSFEIKSVSEFKEDGQEFYRLEGYASVFGNIDRGNDVMIKGCFEESLKGFKPKLLWQHKMDEPIGAIKEIYEDNKGLYFKAILPKSDKLVNDRIMPQIKVGAIDSMSFGYNVRKYDLVKQGEDTLRELKQVDIWEVSLVTIPMNPQATLTYFKDVKDIISKIEDKDIKENNVMQEIKAIKELLAEKTEEEIEKATEIQNKDENETEKEVEENEEEKTKNIECLKSIKELNKYLKSSGFSNKESNVIISKAKSFSRDEEKEARDELLTNINNEVKKIKELLNG